MSNLKIEVEVTELMLEQMKAGDTVVIHTHAELPEPKEPKLYSGYTEEQIKRIITGRYLVEIPDHLPVRMTRLRAFNPNGEPSNQFKIGDHFYDSFKLIRAIGIRQPWFGGEYDGHPNDFVHCLFKSGMSRTLSAGNMLWENVTEYILLEAASNG